MKLFFAYESKDEQAVKEILKHFQPSIKRGTIEVWHRGMIDGGADKSVATQRNLRTSDIVLFFLSADLLAAPFFYEIESEVIRRVKSKKQKLIPVLLRPCDWTDSDFVKELKPQVIPRNQKALLSQEDMDSAIFSLVKEVLKVVHKDKPRKNTIVRPRSMGAGNEETQHENLEKEPVGEFISDDMFSRKVKELLAKNQVKEVFQLLDNVLENSENKKLKNKALLLKTRYQSAISDKRKGVITSENSRDTDSEIFNNLLDLIEQIPTELRAGGLEESVVYLESIKRSTGFEMEQRKYAEVKGMILNTDLEIEGIFKELEEKLNVQKSNSLFTYYEQIKADYHQLIDDTRHRKLNAADKRALEKIRKQLNQLVDDLQKAKSEEMRTAAEETQDLSTADVVLLNEAKLIFIGNGGVGKTALRENLIDENYSLSTHESTDGLEVESWNFNLKNSLTKSVKFNIWDFGGQGRYRAIQQFFCTSKAIYIFVTTPIEKENQTDDNYTGLDYWLNFVKLFGYDPDQNRESPVIYVMNKCDLGGNQTIDETKIKDAFRNVRNFIRVSCKSGQGLPELRDALEKRLEETGMLNRGFPGSWVVVKEELEQLAKTKDLLNFESFLTLFDEKVKRTPTNLINIEQQAKDFVRLKTDAAIRDYLRDFYKKVHYSAILNYWQGVKDMDGWQVLVAERMDLEKRADVLIKYLHAVGVLLYYHKVQSMSHILILNPDWARKLAYDIMNSPYAGGGILRKSDIHMVFPDLRKEYAVDLLQTYKLCYETHLKGETTYFFPSLFPLEEPSNLIDFGAIPFTAQYRCTFSPIIPADFISRLITKLYKFIHRANQFWKYGVLFSMEESSRQGLRNFALVKENWRKNELIINLVGFSWKEMLCQIANEIYSLNEFIGQHLQLSSAQLKEEIKLTGQATFQLLGDKRIKDNNQLLLPIHLKAIEEADDNQRAGDEKEKQHKKATEVIEDLSQKMNKKLLYIAACPEDLQPLRFQEEYTSIDNARTNSGKDEFIDISPKLQVESAKLVNILSEEANYIHISVHGSRKGGLLFVRRNGKSAKIEGPEMEDIFIELVKKQKNIKLVCFSACYSKAFAERIAKHVEYTIGMNGSFPDPAAVIFANIFYVRLFENHPIEFAFKQALREIKREAYPPDGEIEIHKMPYLFKKNKLQIFQV